MSILSVDLCPDHFAEIFSQSSIDPSVADQRGYRTLYGTPEDRQELESLGFTSSVYSRADAYPALLIPMYRATGEVIAHQLKPNQPRMRANGDGKLKPIKYETPRGSRVCVDVPEFTRGRLSDLSTPLWITEGIKKVDALVSQGRAALGLSGVFNWRRKLGTLGDWEDIPLKGRDVVICFDADARDNRNVMLAMTRLGAWLDSKGVRTVHYLIVPAETDGVPVKGADDWFAAGGTVEALWDAATRTTPTSGTKDASMTDAVLTDTVCEESLDGRFVWSAGIGWLAWSGCVWNEVSEVAPTEAIRQWVIDKFQSVLSEQSKNPSRDLDTQLNEWRSVMSRNRINALAALARGNLERRAAEFDADPDLLCVRNGYVDLRTGRLHEPDPDRLMTRCAGIDYAPDASHEAWERALDAVPADLRPWYQDRVGQAATGHMTPDDTLVIAHGDGSNGKSTVVSAVQSALGSYAVLLSDRVLMASADAHPTELMDLRGARYAVLEETPEARRLDVHRLKKTVGTESITARKIRQDDVTFDATHSLFVNTNFRPIVVETDHGTWRRLALMSFPFTFRKANEPLVHELDRQGDPTLRMRRNDPEFRRAVLAWIVQGAVEWYARGRVMMPSPERLNQDTASWRAQTDLVMGFAEDMLRFTTDGRTPARTMLDAFNGWAEGQGHKPWTDKTFSARFLAHDIARTNRVEKVRIRLDGKNSPKTVVWLGVTLGDDGGEEGPFGEPDIFEETVTAKTGDKPGHSGGGHGGHGAPVNSLRVEQLGVTRLACPPCPPLSPSRSEAREKNSDILESPAIQTSCTSISAEGPSDSEAAPTEPVSVTVGEPIGLDLETGSASRLMTAEPGAFIKLVGHGDRVDRSADALCARVRAGQVVVGHNLLGFDMLALERHAELRIEESTGRVWDTQLQAMIADPPTSAETKAGPQFKSYALDAVAQRVLGRSKDDRGKALVAEYCTTPRCAHGISKKCTGWDNIPADDPRYAAYCADDTRLALDLYHAMPRGPYMEREMRVQAIMARMTLNGFRVDTDLLDRRIAQGQERKRAAMEELGRFGLPLVRTTELKNGTVRTTELKSPLSTTEGRAWLQGVYERFGVTQPPRTPKGALATSTDVLRALGDHARCPAELRHIIGLMGVVTSERTIYGTIRDHLVGDRVHPDIWPRQASGRWSVTKPGLTVVGKNGALAAERGVFLPEPGERIIAIDMGQVDARIVAAHAQDPAYAELFGPGRDVHKETAIAMMGDAKYRDACKPISHLANYGGSENKLISMGHDPELVRKFFRVRAEKFPGLLSWQSRVREQGESGQMLDNGFGRPLRVEADRAYTQAPAQVGQGGTRDMMAQGLLDLVRAAPDVLPMLRMIVHDEVVLSVPEEDAEEISRTVVRTFERDWAPKGASVPVYFTAASTAPGVNWADAYKA